MKKLTAWLIKSPIRFFIAALLIIAPIVYILDFFWLEGAGGWGGILVEAHGLVFDLLVFGIILTLYEHYRQLHENAKKEETEKQQRIQRYQDEIDDFRGWDEKEAMFRNVGNIKRLNREGVSEVNLSRSNLGSANLNGANLFGANLFGADLSGANLRVADLRVADLSRADLSRADLRVADLRVANLRVANLSEAIGLSFESLKSSASLYQTKGIPEDMLTQLKQEKPELFKSSPDDLINSKSFQ